MHEWFFGFRHLFAGFVSFEDIVSTMALKADPIQFSNGQVTRARTKRFKEGFSVLIQHI